MPSPNPLPLWNQLTFEIDLGPVQMSKTASKQKYYVVWKGRRTGIFDTWEECSAQVKGFVGARYKSFPTRAEAESAFKHGPTHAKTSLARKSASPGHAPILASISVDAACSGSPGPVEFRGVDTRTGKVIFHEGPYPHGTNNVGEFLAIVHALEWQKQHKKIEPVYSDSSVAIKWVKRKVCNTTLKPDAHNRKLFQLIAAAEDWLKANKLETPILKWETADWGEIPADYNRK